MGKDFFYFNAIKMFITMNETASSVLDDRQIKQKIQRIAYEIYENHFGESQLWLAGIDGQGYELARLLQAKLSEISPIKISLLKVTVDKQAPSQQEVKTDLPIENVKGSSIILVDDVLYTGRTLAYALEPFLHQPIKSLRVAVLVNRSHTVFPVQPTYTGYELSTTLSDHIEVSLHASGSKVVIR